MKFSEDVRNARAAAIEATIGASPSILFFTGPEPADCAAPDSGILIATMPLPADWLSDPVAGTISKVGTWSTTALAAGTIAHYRIKQGATCHEQGSAGITGTPGVDLEIDNPIAEIGQTINVDIFSRTEPHA